MQTVSDFFGCHVFSEAVMKQKLPKAVFKDVYAAIHEGKRLDLAAANVVANSMKDWAIELGATHFTHWFQPMTGITAEKHDSFISPTGPDVLRVHQGSGSVYPDRVLFLRRRGARQKDAAAALHAGHQQAGPAYPEAVRA